MAILNIQIPQVMGGAINVIAKFSETKDSNLFMQEMKIPALKLIGMYLAQVCIEYLIFFNFQRFISSRHVLSFTFTCYQISGRK